MISGIFVLNSRGDSLISRLFRDDVSLMDIDAFKAHAIKGDEKRSPIFKAVGGVTFLFIKLDGVFVVAAMKDRNPDCALVFEVG